jgi:uncharacterized membrane protein YphA (DoxX/SURF4 family)
MIDFFSNSGYTACMNRTQSIAIFLLRISLGVFFLVLGIQGLMMHTSRTSEIFRWFGRNDTLSIIVSVIQVLAGSLLIIGLFVPVGSGIFRLLSLGVLILWGVYMVMTLFLKNFLQPDTLSWLYKTSWSCIILTSLWIVTAKE